MTDDVLFHAIDRGAELVAGARLSMVLLEGQGLGAVLLALVLIVVFTGRARTEPFLRLLADLRGKG